MVIEDIKYQLEQFFSFDNVKLSFEIKNKKGSIFFSNGKVTKAIFDSKQDIDVFRELKDLSDQINIQVSIGEPAPENTLNKSFNEIIEAIYPTNEEKKPFSDSLNEDLAGSGFGNAIPPAVVDKIGEGLSKIVGVEGVIAMKPDGEVLFSKDIEDPDFESADSIFLYNQSKELGDMLDFKNLTSAICEANNYKKIIINNKNVLYSIKVSLSVQSLKTQAEAVKLLENS